MRNSLVASELDGGTPYVGGGNHPLALSCYDSLRYIKGNLQLARGKDPLNLIRFLTVIQELK